MTSLRTLDVTGPLVLSLVAGCSSDVIIGAAFEPIRCNGAFDGVVFDSVANTSTAVTGFRYGTGSDDVAQLSLVAGTTGDIQVAFLCGTPEAGDYSVSPEESVSCPGAIAGAIEGEAADDGVMVLDEVDPCLAGRFALNTKARGELFGWFKTGPLLGSSLAIGSGGDARRN